MKVESCQVVGLSEESCNGHVYKGYFITEKHIQKSFYRQADGTYITLSWYQIRKYKYIPSWRDQYIERAITCKRKYWKNKWYLQVSGTYTIL